MRADSIPNSSREDADERALVARVRAGDRSAFEQIYRTYYRALVGFVYAYLRSEAQAEEEVQELFLAVWCHREEWEPRTTVRAYLFKAARNRALNHLKHEGVVNAVHEDAAIENRTLAMGEAPATQEERFDASDLAAAAQGAIERLPPRCRLAFTLCRSQHLTYAETAQVMGISEHTVKIQMARALAALRLGLARWLP